MTEATTSSIQSAAGGLLATKTWTPEGTPTAAVLVVHGFAEHLGRYEHVAAKLTDAGYLVHAYDLRGHGRSSGTRGHIESLDGLLADLVVVHGDLAAAHPDLPIVLLGHSIGGATCWPTWRASPPHRVDAAVISGPYLQNALKTPAVLLKLAPLMGRIAPRLAFQRFDATTISRDPEVVRRYDTDPFVYRGKVDARTGATLLAAGQRVIAAAGRVTTPILVLQGGDDRVSAVAGTRAAFAAIGSEDKSLEVYDGVLP